MSDTVVVVRPETNVVVAQSPGPPGPMGPQGPAGVSGGAQFVYDRNGVPAATWVIQHNLNRRVHVSTVLDSGELVEGDVQHTDLDNLSVVFSAPQSGVAVIG